MADEPVQTSLPAMQDPGRLSQMLAAGENTNPSPNLNPPITTPGIAPNMGNPQFPEQAPLVGNQPLPPRPPGTGVASQPVSKSEFFRDMLGKFFYAVGTGLANRGQGPGADARGAGAAMTALPELAIRNQQLEIQRQQAEGLAAYHKSQAEALQNRYTPQTWIDEKGVPHQISAQDFAKLKSTELANQTKENVQGAKGETAEKIAGITAGSKEKIAGEQIASKEKLAGASLAEKVNEFRTTDQYKRWKTQLDDDTKIRVADLTANKAPAAMLQTASFSQGALEQMSDAQKAMDTLEKQGVLGKNLLTNKVEAYLFGKGLADPSWDANTRRLMGKMQAALGNTSTATMRAHTGRTSREIYDDYKTRFGVGQDWSALRGAMDETGNLLQHYVGASSNANIKALRSGTSGGTGPLSETEARAYLQQAGGDANKARAMARKDGRTF